jgi:hypothetical protein
VQTCTTQPCDTSTVCGATHYMCSAGTSGSNASTTSAWTWACTSGTSTVSCSQSKNKPKYIEN